MNKNIRNRPEVDEFRYTLYEHLDIDQHDYELRNFIHEMAHNLYNQAYMKSIDKPDKLTDKEFWDLYCEIADDIQMKGGWELGDYLFIGGCVTGVIIIWEIIKYFV